MAPIHHHFELLGWPEPQIIVRFWIISIVCALLALSHAEAAMTIAAAPRAGARRSGATGSAVARVLAARGCAVRVARPPDGRGARRRPRRRGATSSCASGPTMRACSTASRWSSRARACRPPRRCSPRRWRRGIPVVSEIELAVAAPRRARWSRSPAPTARARRRRWSGLAARAERPPGLRAAATSARRSSTAPRQRPDVAVAEVSSFQLEWVRPLPPARRAVCST